MGTFSPIRRTARIALVVLAVLATVGGSAASAAPVGDGGSIRGTVIDRETGAPLANICVEGWLMEEPDGTPVASTKPTLTATTNRQGEYKVGPVPAGHYHVNFRPCPGAKPPTREFGLVVFGTQSDARREQLVRVLEGIPTTSINAAMSRGATIRGRVVGPTGQPLANICAQAMYKFSVPATTVVRSDKDGEFQIRGVTSNNPLQGIAGGPEFAVLVEFTDCSKSPQFAPSFYKQGVVIPSSGATVQLDDHAMGADPPACIPPGLPVRSSEGVVKTTIRFVMRDSGPANVYWLDYQGNRVLYKTITRGESYDQATFVTHPWVIVSFNGGRCLGYVVSVDISQEYVIG